MAISKEDLVLAADGGGTRCRVALSSPSKTLKVEVGAANLATDFEGSIKRVADGIDRLAFDAGVAGELIRRAPAYLGLAGFSDRMDTSRIKLVLGVERLRTEDDRPSAVRGALADADGAVIHCGTGSFLAVQRDGVIRLAGGWGRVLGDHGSAMWFGREALVLTLDAADGLRRPSPLSDTLLNRFGGPEDIVEFGYEASPAAFGELAPMVFADTDDPLASELIVEAVARIESGVLQMDPSSSPICLTGGLAPQLAPFFSAKIRSRLADPAGSPLDGAITLARAFAREVHR